MSNLEKQFFSFSIVVPARNEEKRINQLLASLKQQDYPGIFETIIVDNGSTDQTASIARTADARLVRQPKLGVSISRQLGSMVAKHEIIVHTDADSIVPSDWLSRINLAFQKHPDAVAIAGVYDFYDASWLVRTVVRLFFYPLFVVCRWYSGANLAIKRTALEKIGGFDNSIPLGEDTNIARRLKKLGRVVRLPSLRVSTSGRRFNELGFWGGLWSYAGIHVRMIFNQHKTRRLVLCPGSEVISNSLVEKIVVNLVVPTLIFMLLLRISPAHTVSMIRHHYGIGHHSKHHSAQRA